MTEQTNELDGEVVVAIEKDDAATTTVAPTGGESTPVEDLKAQFRELQGQAERERAARAESDRRAVQASADAERAKHEAALARSETAESHYDQITTGLTSALAEIDAAKREIKSAGEAGDYEKQADAYDRLADARARAVSLTGAKTDLDIRKSRAAIEADNRSRPTPVEPSTADPVETFIASRSAPTQQWLRDHREWIADPKKNAKLSSAHYSAMSEGIAVDSAEYFSHVETFLGLRANGAGANREQQEQQQQRSNNGQFQRKASAPVAPGAASGGGTSGGGAQVRLTKGEAQVATDGTHVWNYDDPSGQKKFRKGDPIGVQEFARRKLQMQKDGHYDKSYVEQ